MEVCRYVELLKWERDGYSDEIPDQLLHSTIYVDGKPVNPKFKVRKAWWQGTLALFDEGERSGYLDQKSQQLWDELQQHLEGTDFHNRLTTREDIDKANSLLTSIIERLEARSHHD